MEAINIGDKVIVNLKKVFFEDTFANGVVEEIIDGIALVTLDTPIALNGKQIGRVRYNVDDLRPSTEDAEIDAAFDAQQDATAVSNMDDIESGAMTETEEKTEPETKEEKETPIEECDECSFMKMRGGKDGKIYEDYDSMSDSESGEPLSIGDVVNVSGLDGNFQVIMDQGTNTPKLIPYDIDTNKGDLAHAMPLLSFANIKMTKVKGFSDTDGGVGFLAQEDEKENYGLNEAVNRFKSIYKYLS